MLKSKLAEQEVEGKGCSVFYNLREAHRYGLISDMEYSH